MNGVGRNKRLSAKASRLPSTNRARPSSPDEHRDVFSSEDESDRSGFLNQGLGETRDHKKARMQKKGHLEVIINLDTDL